MDKSIEFVRGSWCMLRGGQGPGAGPRVCAAAHRCEVTSRPCQPGRWQTTKHLTSPPICPRKIFRAHRRTPDRFYDTTALVGSRKVRGPVLSLCSRPRACSRHTDASLWQGNSLGSTCRCCPSSVIGSRQAAEFAK